MISDGQEFPVFFDEDCLRSEQDLPEFPVQEECQSRGADSPKRGPVSTRKTGRLHEYEYFRVTGAYDTVLDYADFSLSPFMMTIFRNSIQDEVKFYYLCPRFPWMISWKVCTN